jgi:hypothetical protein
MANTATLSEPTRAKGEEMESAALVKAVFPKQIGGRNNGS